LDDLLIKWSKDRDPDRANCKHFASIPTIPLAVWTSAYHWAFENRKVLRRSGQRCTRRYFTAATGNPLLSSTTLTAYETGNGRWPSFEAFKTNYFGVWVITIRDSLQNSSCTCPPYINTMMCKHLLGMHKRLHFVQTPEEAKSIPFGRKRKRG